MPNTHKKTCLITGSSSGIGFAASQLLLNQGYTVFGIARHQTIHHSNYEHLSLDLSNPQEVSLFCKKLHKHPLPVQSLICNAGIGIFGHLEELSWSRIEEAFQVNLLSHIQLIQALLPNFKKRKSGNILLIGSEAGLQGKRQGSIYCATKFALRGFAQSLRAECAKSKVRVTLLQPGSVHTPFYHELHFKPMEGREFSLDSQDIAEAIDWILHSPAHVQIDEINLTPFHHSVQKQT